MVIASEFNGVMYRVGMLHKIVEFLLAMCPDEKDVINEP